MTASRTPAPRKRSAAAAVVFVAIALSAVPAVAEFRLDYAPEVNLERLDVALIDEAKSSIDMAAYLLTDVPVIDALVEAAGRGVAVRIYFEPDTRPVHGAVAEALARLNQAPGVVERTKTRGALMHLKSYLVDSKVLRGGAANFSASGLKQQDNDRFETDDPAAVAAFRRAFERAWARG